MASEADVFKDLLMRARDEIIALRRTNEVLAAKVEMIDLFALVLDTKPGYRNQSACVDVAWELQEVILNTETSREA